MASQASSTVTQSLPPSQNYDSWSREELIARLNELEAQAQAHTPQNTTTSESDPPRQPSPPHTDSPPSHPHSTHPPPRPSHTHPPIPATAPITTSTSTSTRTPPAPPPPKKFSFTSHPTLKIALKFSYHGASYAGLAHQLTPTPLPTVEQVLFDALAKAKLVDGEAGFEGCGWERCGRTDRGVSAAGQVVSVWVRAGRVGDGLGGEGAVMGREAVEDVKGREGGVLGGVEGSNSTGTLQAGTTSAHSVPVKPLRYMKTLNRLLPPTIRVHAWSPVDADFSSRFNCQYRHYKYFFTNSSFDIFPSAPSLSSTPTPTNPTMNEAPVPHGVELDIERMREAAARLVGTHDFRNLCKLDAGKQIEVFERTILSATVSPLSSALTSSPAPPSSSSPPTPATSTTVGNGNGLGMYVFDLVGTAFLYHQVRHIMAILFLVGTGLESPALVTRLLHSTPSSPDADAVAAMTGAGEGELEGWEVVDRKPEYQMADGLPLMLWDCAYKEGDVRWRTDDDDRLLVKSGVKGGKKEKEEEDAHGLHGQMASVFERSVVNTTLEAHFLLAAMRFPFNRPGASPFPLDLQTQGEGEGVKERVKRMGEEGVMMNIPLGGGTYKRVGKYVPVLERNRLDSVEVANERWRVGKGMRRMERRRAVAEDAGGEE